jgi:glycosyltransferase involved in cell wall biosynthesis
MFNHVSISAYVICFNAAATLRQSVESLLKQTVVPSEVIVVDDSSTDGSGEALNGLPVKRIRHAQNLGRGAARQRAMLEAREDMVLCCDACTILLPDFTAKALVWFDQPDVAAVFGRMTQPLARNTVDRWRSRHLLRLNQPMTVKHHTLLATGGALVNATKVRQVGNFNPHLRHTEDGDLGARLLAAGYDVIQDPQLEVRYIARNTLAQVLERYWRWNAGANEQTRWKDYLRQVYFACRVMMMEDLRQKDPLSMPISFFSPHYQFWRSRWGSKPKLKTK